MTTRLRPHPVPLGLCLAVTAGLAAGCSSFESRWREAGRTPEPADSIRGRWIGTWQNTNNDHQSSLRAILRPAGSNQWTAEFHARYAGVLTFGINTLLTGASDGAVVHFQGQKDLGFFAGGVYRFDGTASPTNFFSTYQSDQNSGTFRMKRPSD